MRDFVDEELELATRSLRELPRPSLPAMPEGHRRLLVLAEFLEGLPAERFNITMYTNRGEDLSLGDCGTSGCALGWAASLPEFKALGLCIGEGGLIRYDDALTSFHAAEKFFEIDFRIGKHFFSASQYVGRGDPRDAAARIRTFVAEQSAIASRTAEVGK